MIYSRDAAELDASVHDQQGKDLPAQVFVSEKIKQTPIVLLSNDYLLFYHLLNLQFIISWSP